MPPFTQQNADSPEKQLSQEAQPNDIEAAAAAGELGVGQAAASNNHTPAAVGQQYPAVTPVGPLSILRRPGENIAANLAVRFGGAGATKDCVMQGNDVENMGGDTKPLRQRTSSRTHGCWCQLTAHLRQNQTTVGWNIRISFCKTKRSIHATGVFE